MRSIDMLCPPESLEQKNCDVLAENNENEFLEKLNKAIEKYEIKKAEEQEKKKETIIEEESEVED